MNSKSLVFIAFAVWSAICWRWYVCNIKEACVETAASMVSNGNNSGIEPAEDTAQTSDIQPLTHSDNKIAAGQRAQQPTQPLSSSRIDEVQMEFVEDRMVIHFPYNSIRKEDNMSIDDYLSRLADELISSGSNVSITGHTDFVGDAKFNKQFGLQRANSIRAILIKKGVPKSQIKTHSFGESKAIATNDTPWGRYQNRRVEIRVNN